MKSSSSHKNSLSFLIYSVYAVALWCFYYGFTQVINGTLNYLIIDNTREAVSLFWRVPFSLNYGESATLLLVGGILFFTMRFLERRSFRQNMIEVTAGPRIWILRVILLLAGSSVTYDFYYLISHFLGAHGESIDLLHTVVMLGIGLLILLFVGFNLSGRFQPKALLFNSCSATLLVFTLGMIAFSIYMAPPHLMKKLRMDSLQLDNLKSLMDQIRHYYSKKKELPQSLDDLLEAGIEKRYILDLSTETPYEYNTVGRNSFKICATFQRDRKEMDLLYNSYGPFEFQPFDYKSGRSCHIVNLGIRK